MVVSQKQADKSVDEAESRRGGDKRGTWRKAEGWQDSCAVETLVFRMAAVYVLVYDAE